MAEAIVSVTIERGDGTELRYGARVPHPESHHSETQALDGVLAMVALTMADERRKLAETGIGSLDWHPIAGSEPYLTPSEQMQLEEDVPEHAFLPGPSGISCRYMVLRGDSGEDCGLPARSIVHEPGA